MSTKSKSKSSSLVGARFRSVRADASCLWEVKRARGRGVFECEVVNEPFEFEGHTYDSDFAGVRDVFTRESIERALRHQEVFKALMDRQDTFYSSLEEGQILHYHDGFGAYIRCRAVRVRPEHVSPHDPFKFGGAVGEMVLEKVEYVGNWLHFDLSPGSFRRSQIGKVFRPHYTNLYESPDASTGAKQTDPRQLPAIILKD